MNHLITAAQALQRVATSPVEGAFWTGYLQGLRRREHGETFGTPEQHQLWLTLINDLAPTRHAQGRGYKAGFEGLPPMEAIKTIALWRCLRCGHEWESADGQPPKRCAKCKHPGWHRPARVKKRGAE